jgi:hypothetical protein
MNRCLIWHSDIQRKLYQSITKFHWAMSKLPFSLIPTVRPLSRDPTAIADPYRELKELLLRSYGLSDEQRTSKWLDYPMCSGENRPSVLWDNLTALQPSTLKEAQVALFLCKLPRHISALINTRSLDTTEEMIQRCNALWMSQTPRRPLPPPRRSRGHGRPVAAFFSSERPQIPLSVPPQDARRRQGRRQIGPPPFAHPWGSRGRPQPWPVFLPLPLRLQGSQVRKGLHIPGKRIGQRPAHSPPPCRSYPSLLLLNPKLI